MGKRFNVMLVPEDGGDVRTFRASTHWVAPIVLTTVLGVVCIAVSAFVFKDAISTQGEIDLIARENSELKDHLADLSGRLEAVHSVVQTSEAMEREARLLAGLDPMDEQTRRLGVGGPAPTMKRFTRDDATERKLTSQSGLLEELERRVQFQRASYEETIGTLRDQKDRIDRTPTISPLRSLHAVSSHYGWRNDPFTGERAYHYGVDLRAAVGTPVYATATGKVTYVGKKGDYGLTIKIDHGNGVETKFAHLAESSCKKGDEVTRGDVIATLGNSGRSTGPHIHYEVRVNGVAQNPNKYILTDSGF